MSLSHLKRNVSIIMMLIVLTGSSVFTGTGILSASESRPAKGSIQFGADNNPLAGAADKIGSFKTLFGDIAEKVIPTVVSVIPTKVDTIVFQNNPFYNFFGDEFGDPFEFSDNQGGVHSRNPRFRKRASPAGTRFRCNSIQRWLYSYQLSCGFWCR